MKFIKSFLNKLYLFYPLTINGTLLLLFSLILFGIAFGSWNLYALFFSIVSFFLIITLLLFNILLKFKNQDETISLEVSQNIIARLQNQQIKVLCSIESLPFFFRIHYVLKGKFKAGRSCEYNTYIETSIKPTTKNDIHISLYYPFSGIHLVQSYVFIKDILNLTKTKLKNPQEYKLYVIPPLFTDKSHIHFLPSITNESLRNIQTSEEEKYFMREYIPGDRLKDINWKSSIKLNELITKISPSSPEESNFIYIEIRPYHYHPSKDGINAILQLNYLKSWVLSFIHMVRREHPKYKFQVFTGKESLLVEEEEDLNILAKKLVDVEYMNKPSVVEPSVSYEKFIFTTGFDYLIESYLSTTKSKIYLFIVLFGEKRKVPFFYSNMFNITPGLWIFRKEKLRNTLPKVTNGKIMDEKIKFIFI